NVPSLFLPSRALAGDIPKELGALSMLQRLVLYNNKLTGHIPKELGVLSKLKTLELWRNKLTGPIPKELGALSELKELDLHWNELTGEKRTYLPSVHRRSKSFELLEQHVSCRRIGRTHPWNLIEISNYFDIYAGAIPAQLGALNELTWLDLSDNQLSGSIRPELGNLAALETLDL
ncbi:unnamed protein product, partial [Hapterophycus canaliculatus]